MEVDVRYVLDARVEVRDFRQCRDAMQIDADRGSKLACGIDQQAEAALAAKDADPANA